ncbi:hypothetical protein HMPREF0868_0679 [Mageeibacillus indolicus UPII9-5]|uniref:Uncharacterized protein n=1 Tax=Mageeibacillus indolicus (strain UPII9-5) TaxID=699246 RepID=D3R1E4_MAGIU|nr:hypothetical protein HMPREF0868_0679 [Mageeibacillus indolicus UPII9-5]
MHVNAFVPGVKRPANRNDMAGALRKSRLTADRNRVINCSARVNVVI